MQHVCRFCSAPLKTTFADLGMSPISNAFVDADRAQAVEAFYPLQAYVCDQCFLVQLIDFEKAEHLFTPDYAYFSSYSASWLEHARRYAHDMIEKEKLGPNSLVAEIASNDGYLLQYFKQSGVPVLGVEPTANTAKIAFETRGVPTRVVFFGRETASAMQAEGLQADLIAANNVLAHVPDVNDFVSGFPILLKQGGLLTVEFPHLLSQMENNQFDTIYHEHFSYLSFTVARRIFSAHGMRVYDAAELDTHGGSLRLFVCHADNAARSDTAAVATMLQREADAGLGEISTYERFASKVTTTKFDLLEFFLQARREGKSIVGYGAPAKGVTLLNYCGVKPDLMPFTVDLSPHKAGKLLPGVRIPILEPSAIFDAKPAYVLILPWNLKAEIMEQMAGIRAWGGQFVTPIPKVEIH